MNYKNLIGRSMKVLTVGPSAAGKIYGWWNIIPCIYVKISNLNQIN